MLTVDTVQNVVLIVMAVAIFMHDRQLERIGTILERIVKSKWFPEPREERK